MLRSIPKIRTKELERNMCMSFFVKCPKQRPVQGRFKKVQTCPPSGRRVYGAIEDKGTLPFGLEQFGLEFTAERLRAKRLCTILKRPTPVNV
jgi:hypothetical protein